MKTEKKYVSPRRLSTFLDMLYEKFALKSTTVSSVKIEGGDELRDGNNVTLPLASATNDGMLSSTLYKNIQAYMIGDLDIDGGRASTPTVDYKDDFDGGGA